MTQSPVQEIDADRCVRTIDGSYCTLNRRVGYCWNRIHRGVLTRPQMEQHQCIERNCHYFQKYPDAEYWQRKAQAKERRQNGKMKAKARAQAEAMVLETIRDITADDDTFFAIRANETSPGHYTVRYLRFAWVNLATYRAQFERECGVRIHLEEIKTDYESKIKILQVQKLI